ncbi:hypothetical protein BL107_12365 [Synechococcus sp. BL107]|nr:hypothetical protein BL107_12365 [Synechococcus sp. BL107]
MNVVPAAPPAMVAREGLAVVARLEDARHRLVIPAGIPTADRRGDMTTADRRGSARAVIVLMGIVHPAVAHQLSVIRTIVLRMTAFLAIAALPIGRQATAHRVIAFRKIAFPVIVRLVIVLRESDPPVTVHQAIVPTDAGTALALAPTAKGISRDRAPMDAEKIAEKIVLRAFQVALMTMASVPMNVVMTRARVPRLRIGSVRIARPKDASVIVLNDHPIDTVPAMNVASRPKGPALATRLPVPSVPICRPRLKPRRRLQMI